MVSVLKIVITVAVCMLLLSLSYVCIGATNIYASAEGGEILDKVYVPARTYIVDYHGKETEFIGSAQYTFVVAVNENECESLVVDREVYLTHNIGDEFYRSEE